MIAVKLIELGAEVKEFTLEGGSDVADLFDIAEKTFVDGSVTRDGGVVRDNCVLRDKDRIFNGKATKGNLEPFEVSFIKLGDATINLAADDGYTIKRTLDQLSDAEKGKFYRPDGSAAFEYRVRGTRVEETHVLQRPSQGVPVRVVCAQRVKGNK